MRPFLAAVAVACAALLAFPAAQAQGLRSLDTQAEIHGFEAVGRIDYRGRFETSFCTGTLVTRSLVLTAAHCVVNADGSARAPETLSFRAGLRRGLAKSERRVGRVAVHPAYRHGPKPTAQSVATDLALLELDRPLDYWSVPPLPATARLKRGQSVQVVSYAEGRDDTPSREAACSVLARDGAVLALDCEATFGASGSPVFVATAAGPRIVSVVSAIGSLGGQRATYAVTVADAVPALLRSFPPRQSPRQIAAPGSRTIRPGEQGGASGSIRFLRPGQ